MQVVGDILKKVSISSCTCDDILLAVPLMSGRSVLVGLAARLGRVESATSET